MSHSASACLERCRQCPRLVARHLEVRQAYPDYHAAPVGAWGPADARVLLVGLAPGLHGASRTGRAFVGDASGYFLFQALFRNGFATSEDPARARLLGMRITNAVKCLPPGNAPTTAELTNCRGFLQADLAPFDKPKARKSRVVVALGGVAHRAVCTMMGIRGAKFTHGQAHLIHRRLSLVSSFHPSRLNVNTGRVTAQMMDDMFQQVRKLL